MDLIASYGLRPSTSVRDELALNLYGAHYSGLLYFTYTDFEPDAIPTWLRSSKINPDRPAQPARVVIAERKLKASLIYNRGGFENAIRRALAPDEWDTLQIVEDGRWVNYHCKGESHVKRA